jgi:hypothetical protein
VYSRRRPPIHRSAKVFGFRGPGEGAQYSDAGGAENGVEGAVEFGVTVPATNEAIFCLGAVGIRRKGVHKSSA